MSASLSWISGKAMAPAAIRSVSICSRRARGIRAKHRVQTEIAASVVVAASSGPVGGGGAEQSGRTEHQDENQDREDDHVDPGIGDELAAHCLDHADDDAAEHGAGNIADAAQP